MKAILYEVSVALHSGYILNLLLGADAAPSAITEAKKLLLSVGVLAGADYDAETMQAARVLDYRTEKSG